MEFQRTGRIVAADEVGLPRFGQTHLAIERGSMGGKVFQNGVRRQFACVPDPAGRPPRSIAGLEIIERRIDRLPDRKLAHDLGQPVELLRARRHLADFEWTVTAGQQQKKTCGEKSPDSHLSQDLQTAHQASLHHRHGGCRAQSTDGPCAGAAPSGPPHAGGPILSGCASRKASSPAQAPAARRIFEKPDTSTPQRSAL